MSTATLSDSEITEQPEWVRNFPGWITSETRFEILDGEYVEIEPMSASASVISGRISQYISDYARREHGESFPEVLVALPGSTRRRRPDAIYVCYDQWPKGQKIPPGVSWSVLPQMCLEVISPTDLFEGIKVRMAEYFAAGVSEVWIASPTQKLLEIYTSMTQSRGYRSPDVVDCSPLLPGFQLNLADVL